jgi:hypothetical protein
MSQQINLFDARFRRLKPHFSSATLVLALAAVLALSIVIQQVYAFQNRTLQATLAQTDKRASDLREQALRFAREFGEHGRSNALAEEIVRVEEQLRVRGELLGGLKGGAGGTVDGFSPFLTALARRTMDGVWITGVQIEAPSGDLVLKGRVLDSGLVPAYIRRLNEEPLFQGRPVSELSLAARTEPGKRFVEFSLQIPLRRGAS